MVIESFIGMSRPQSLRYLLSRRLIRVLTSSAVFASLGPKGQRHALAFAWLAITSVFPSLWVLNNARTLADWRRALVHSEPLPAGKPNKSSVCGKSSPHELLSLFGFLFALAGEFRSSLDLKQLALRQLQNHLLEWCEIATGAIPPELPLYMISAGADQEVRQLVLTNMELTSSDSAATARFSRFAGWNDERKDLAWQDLIDGREVVLVGPAPDPGLNTRALQSHKEAFYIWIGAISPNAITGGVENYGLRAEDVGIALNGANSRWLMGNHGLLKPGFASWLLSKDQTTNAFPWNQHQLEVSTALPYLSGSPNMLPILIADALLHRAGKVFVYGADFFIGRESYRDEARYHLPSGQKLGPAISASGSPGDLGEVIGNIARHDPIENFTLTKCLAASNRVGGTLLFESAISLTAPEYASQLELRFHNAR